MREEHSIEANDLTRKFGDFTAVDQITFNVRKGEIFGFLGANGAGKTTAIRMLSGLLKPSGGQAIVAGYDVRKQAEKVKARIGYMSQKFSLYEDLSVYENFRFYGGVYGVPLKVIKERSHQLMERLGLLSKRDELLDSLPLGWKQKLAFAVASIHDPEIIFLDEPTSGVDPITRRQFWEMIYEASHYGTTIFITTHYMEESEYCNRISIMVDGKIKALNTPSELKKEYQAETMDEVFIKLARNK